MLSKCSLSCAPQSRTQHNEIKAPESFIVFHKYLSHTRTSTHAASGGNAPKVAAEGIAAGTLWPDVGALRELSWVA